MSPDEHIERAERLLSVCDNLTPEGRIGFSLQAMVHLKMAELMTARERVL